MSILRGMDKMVNMNNVRKDVSLSKFEDLMEATDQPPPKINYADELSKLSSEIGIDFEGSGSGSGSNSADLSSGAGNSIMDSTSKMNLNDSAPPIAIKQEVPTETIHSSAPESGYKLSSELESRTNEKIQYDHVKRAMNSMGVNSGPSYSLESEKREDSKSHMLEEIDFLREELENCGYTIDNRNIVSYSSSYEEIESCLKVLRHKMDRIKYCEFAEQFLMVGAYAVEELFNGKREWLGYTPDLTGWSDTVAVKLRRMRHDTSQIVSQTMNDYNIGPGTRLALELIPSAISFSRQRKNELNRVRFNSNDVIEAQKSLPH